VTARAPARVVVAHTADLEPAALTAVRALLDDVFDGELDDHDFEHALGGIHALAYDADDHDSLVGHASVVQRRLIHRDRALRAGYVEAVGVRADHRRCGVGAQLMGPLERVIRNAYDLGALGATDDAIPFYAARGWRAWPGPLGALTPTHGVTRTPDEEGAVFLLTSAVGPRLDPVAPLVADWREGDVW
jgi:aminoglycoside 2'-N-acetyltransferase I